MTRRIDKPDTVADQEIRKCIDKKINFIMIAGAGSGKTTSLVKSLDYIERSQGESLRKRGQKIACITYTTRAEEEILNDIEHNSLFHVSTIHSFLWSLIEPFQVNIEAWISQRIEEKINTLYEEKAKFTPTSRHIQATRDKNAQEILKYEDMRIKINAVRKFRYETGSNYLKGILGHDDIIKMGPDLIQGNPLLRTIIAKKYPFFFIDESQDTILEVVNALKAVALQEKGRFCLGFFGDPMQKIYLTGIGKVAVELDWQEIKKPENFRCPTGVLNVINNIRLCVQDDDFQQTGGRKENVDGILQTVNGTAQLFILPADENREKNIHRIRKFLANKNNDSSWLSNEKDAGVKILVIEHRLAANRLKFSDLYSAFKDDSTDSLSISFSEGKAWALQPFQRFLLPLVEAYKNNNQFEILRLLREHCPLLQKEKLRNIGIEPFELLSLLKQHICELSKLLTDENASISDVLKFTEKSQLMELDERISIRLKDIDGVSISDDNELDKIKKVMASYFTCPAAQAWGYQIYINDESPYSTQHGVKGSEFERVLVVLDDEEGKRSTLYSYEKLLGLKPSSDNDKKNQDEGRETVYDRTRRLLYVCCSRAVRDLAVVLFASETQHAITKLREEKIFGFENILTIEDIETTLI